MRTSISNLNGEQQNTLYHLAKSLKRALRPLMIICYGHRSTVTFQSSAFFNGGMEKKISSVFDLFLVVSDEEVLPDSALQEIAGRSCATSRADNILIFRMKEVLLHLEHKNRFFSGIFRKGILLYGHADALNMLPHPLPPTYFTNDLEKDLLQKLLQHAQQCLKEADHHLKEGYANPQLIVILLNEAAASALRYFMTAHWGIDLQGDLKRLLSFSENVSDTLKAIFPNNTMEEALLFHVINLSFIDEGFCPGPYLTQTLLKRVSKMVSVSQRDVQQKISGLPTA